MRGYYELNSSVKLDSFPTGAASPYSYIMGDSSGLITATTTLFQSNTFENINLAGGLNGESSIMGSGDLTGQLGALAFLITSITGSNSLSSDIQGLVDIAANLTASGDLSGALGALIDILSSISASGDLTGDIAGALDAISNITASGDLVSGIQAAVFIASDILGDSSLTSSIIGNWNMICSLTATSTLSSDIQAIANLLSDLTSSGALTISTGAVIGSMFADIVSCGGVTADDIAAAVWSSLAASFNVAGTLGEKLNNAGAAADPWDIDLSGYNDPVTAGKILKQIKSLAQAGL